MDEIIVQALADDVIDLYIDDEGNEHYRLGPNARERAPELVEAHMEEVNELIWGLYEGGLVDVSIREDGEWIFNLTELGQQALDSNEV